MKTKNCSKNILLVLICCALVLIVASGCASGVVDYGKNTKYYGNAYMEFGSYPQSEVDVDSAEKLEAEYAVGALQKEDGYYCYDGKRFSRVVVRNNYFAGDKSDEDFFKFTRYELNSVHWFEVEPLKWRVLNTQNGVAILVTEKLIDCMAYSDGEGKSYLWENSAVREFLNGEFYDSAFSSEEKNLILNHSTECSYISNPGRLKYAREDVSDNVRLLYWKEARLSQQFPDDDARKAYVTDYAAARGGARLTAETIEEYFPEYNVDEYKKYLGCGIYWLMETELNMNCVYIVYEYGNTASHYASEGNRTLRPVIVMDAKSVKKSIK